MTKITSSEVKAVAKVASLAGFFIPTKDHQKLKSMFWSRWAMGPVRSDDEITAAAVAQITDSTVIEKWWRIDGFKSWFKNNNTMAEDIDTNASIALDTLRELMASDIPAVRLNAAKESIKAKQELDKERARKEETGQTVDPDQLQKLLNSALAAGIIKLPGGGHGE